MELFLHKEKAYQNPANKTGIRHIVAAKISTNTLRGVGTTVMERLLHNKNVPNLGKSVQDIAALPLYTTCIRSDRTLGLDRQRESPEQAEPEVSNHDNRQQNFGKHPCRDVAPMRAGTRHRQYHSGCY